MQRPKGFPTRTTMPDDSSGILNPIATIVSLFPEVLLPKLLSLKDHRMQGDFGGFSGVFGCCGAMLVIWSWAVPFALFASSKKAARSRRTDWLGVLMAAKSRNAPVPSVSIYVLRDGNCRGTQDSAYARVEVVPPGSWSGSGAADPQAAFKPRLTPF